MGRNQLRMPCIWLHREAAAITLNCQHEIEINDIKKAIADSRPTTARTEAMLESTDWKSISNVLTPKYDTFQNGETPQNPYTVQRHKVTQKRAFLPSISFPPSMTMKAI